MWRSGHCRGYSPVLKVTTTRPRRRTTSRRRNAPTTAAALQWLMAARRTVVDGWFPVARAAEVGTTPVPVGAGGRAYVVVRLRPGGEVSAFPARCPHRLVPLAAGTGRRRPAAVPGTTAGVRRRGPLRGHPLARARTAPRRPRADLRDALGGRGAARLGLARPRADDDARARPGRSAAPEPAPAPAGPPAGPVFDNLDPSLEHAWHPVALSRELRPGGWLQVRLLGRTWTLRRDGDAPGRRPARVRRPRAARRCSGWRRPSRPTSPSRCPRPPTAGS